MTGRLLWLGVAILAAVGGFATPSQAQSALSGRVQILANGAYQASSEELRQSFSQRAYGEDALFEAVHDIKGGAMLDFGGSIRVYRELSIGAIYTDLDQAGSATLTGSVPHPILFNSDRAITPQTVSLAHRERTTHIFAAWRVPISQIDGLDVSVYGGPSYVNLTQGLIHDVGVAEAGGPPFASVNVTEVQVEEQVVNGWGAHVGADVTYMFTSAVGLGGFVRFSSGSIDVPAEAGTISVTVGGVQTGGGIRLRF